MTTIDTTRVRQGWVDKTLEELGTVTRFAEKLGVSPSTASRWIEPGKDANGGLSDKMCVCYRRVAGLDVAFLDAD